MEKGWLYYLHQLLLDYDSIKAERSLARWLELLEEEDLNLNLTLIVCLYALVVVGCHFVCGFERSLKD